MARMPGADWHPVRNYTPDGQQTVRGVVVHIMAGTLEGSQAWFNNQTAQASSHFGTGKDGELRQWVDTDDRAWAQAAGNRDWLSVENEGVGGDALTTAQLDANARVLAWAHKTYGVPLQVAKSPSDRGLGYHAMGGAAWGGHTSCPGTRIVAQLPEIVARAKRLVAGPTQEEDSMDAKQIFSAVWMRDAAPAPSRSATVKKNPMWSPVSFLREIYDLLATVNDSVKALTKRLDAIEKKG